MTMTTKLSLLLITAIFSCGKTLLAANPQAREQIIITHRVDDDLYLAAETIEISAPVHGDVVAAGGSISIEDTVTGDLLLGGGEIDLSGYTSDDIRIFGGTIDLRGNTGGDLMVFGGKVIVHSSAIVHGDVLVFGGQLEFAGTLKGNLKAYGGQINITGNVTGNIDLRGGEIFINSPVGGDAILVAEDLDLGNRAQLTGKVRYYTSDGEMNFGQATSNAIYDESLGEDFDNNRNWSGGGFVAFLLFSLLSSMLVSLVLIFVFGRQFSRGASHLQTEFFKSFGFGMLYFIGVPVALFILMVSVIGIPLGLLGICLYIFSLVFGPTFAAVLLTYWLNRRNTEKWNRWLIVLISGGIFLVVWLLVMVPFVGWLIGIVLIGATFGALLLALFKRRLAPAL